MAKYRDIIFNILLCAAFVMIINNMRPHHHHHQQVCFISYHCDAEAANSHSESHDDDGFDHSHSHPLNDQCKVNSYYIIPTATKVFSKLPSPSQYKKFFQDFPSIHDATIKTRLPESGNKVIACRQTCQAVNILFRAERAPPTS